MTSETTASENEHCCQCGRTLQIHSSGMPMDEHTMVCETCYRIMMAPEHKPGMMEIFD